MTPGLEPDLWSGTITRDSLADLGRQIKETVPKEKLSHYGSDIQEGFNNLNPNPAKPEPKKLKLLFTLLYISPTIHQIENFDTENWNNAKLYRAAQQ